MAKTVSSSKLEKIINKFSGREVLVLGDCMVDRFVWGKVGRISPEAPVPVVKVEKETVHLGGAGNVINNLAALGAKCSLVGVIGGDSAGGLLKKELGKKGVTASGLYEDVKLTTTVKTRVIAASQQVVRVDREDPRGFSGKVIAGLIDRFKSKVSSAEAVIISDYGKGVINGEVLSAALSVCRRSRIPVIVDPKIEHFRLYKGVACITPNLKEAMEGMFFRKVNDLKDLKELGRRILKKLNAGSVLITRGEHGMSLFEKSGKVAHMPTVAREVFDVTGAGDTVISVLTLSHICGASLFESAYLSNIAGGIVVGKIGTAVVSSGELLKWLKDV